MSDDVTRLAETTRQNLALVIGRTNPRTRHVYIDGNDACLAIADHLLASEWLAERDALNRLAGAVQAKSDAIDAHAELVARMEALCDELLEVSPPEFDSKVKRPELAHERCKLPGCNLRPWGLGTVTPDEPRYCVAHDTAAEIQTQLRAALNDPTEETTP